MRSMDLATDCNGQFARKALAHKVLLGLNHVPQRVGFSHYRPDFVSFDVSDEVLEDPLAFEPDKIIHFQIEHAGSLLFGAYDNFDDECVFAFPPISEEDLQIFKNEKIIKSYNQLTGS